MPKKEKKQEKIAYDSELFRRLNQSLESGMTANKPRIFTKLADALVLRRIVSKTGKVAANRESSLDYLEMVLPRMTSRDFAVLETEPEIFVEKYVFSPSNNKTSLALYLQDQEILDNSFELKADLGWHGDSSEIFEEFREQCEMSPFEKCDKYVAVNFWGDSQD